MGSSDFGINLFHGDGQNPYFHTSVSKNATQNVIQKRQHCSTTPQPLALVPWVGVAALCVRLHTSLRSNIYVLAFSFALVNSHARMQLSKQLR